MTPQQQERFASAIRRIGGDGSVLPIVAKMTVEDVPKLYTEVDTAVATRRYDDIGQAAHKLKGTLSTFDTGQATDRVEELILAAKAENENAVATAWDRCRPSIDGLMSEIAELCEPSHAVQR